jgi:flagellar motility protein MotE (MotC chaperone)
MKNNIWTYFMLGLFLTATFVAVVTRETAAEDARVRKVEGAEISGLKVPAPGEKDVSAALTEREERVKGDELRLKEVEARLGVEEARVKARIDELQKIQDDLVTQREKNAVKSSEVLTKLVKTYEKMAPKKAASVIAVMKDELAVELLLSMKEKSVATILDSMDPNRAMQISTLIADRRPAGSAKGESKKERR